MLHSFTCYTTAHALIYDTSIFLRVGLGGGEGDFSLGGGNPRAPPPLYETLDCVLKSLAQTCDYEHQGKLDSVAAFDDRLWSL